MKQFIGKYASGSRKAAAQAAQQREIINSLPLATRKAMRARDVALVAYNTAVIDGADRDTLLTLGNEYRAAVARVDAMIGVR